MYRALVTALDSRGVYVQVPDFGPAPLGPLEWIGDTPRVGQRVIALDTDGNPSTPDLVVIGGVGDDGNQALTWKGGNVSAWNYGEYADIPQILNEIETRGLNVVTIPVRVTADSLTDSAPEVDADHLAHALNVATALPARVKVIAEPYPFIADGTLSETLWNPSNVSTWFANWTAACVQVAQAFPQAVMTYIGSNIAMLEADHDAEWIALADAVRAVTTAEVAYRCNWWYETARLDALCEWPFLRHVDVTAVAAYFELTDTPSPDYDEVRACLDGSLIYDRGQDIVSEVARLHAATGRPIFFGELACSRYTEALSAPYDPDTSATHDPMVQARMYRAYTDAFAGFDWWRGFSIFNIGGFGDSGYRLSIPAINYVRSIPTKG